MNHFEESPKTRIANCFIQLVVESSNPRERVSVTEIFNRLGMDRKGFYRHFESTTDLVVWIFRSELAQRLSGREFAHHQLEYPDPALKDKYGNMPFFARPPLVDGALDQSTYFQMLCSLFNKNFKYYQHILSYPCYLDFYYYLVELYKPAFRNDTIALMGGDTELIDDRVVDFLSEYHTIAVIGRLPYHYTIKKRPLPEGGLEKVWNYSHETLRHSVDYLIPAT